MDCMSCVEMALSPWIPALMGRDWGDSATEPEKEVWNSSWKEAVSDLYLVPARFL